MEEVDKHTNYNMRNYISCDGDEVSELGNNALN